VPTTDTLHKAVLHLAKEQQRRYYGKFRGIVTDNNDPDKQGRIRGKVPELFGDEQTGWAMPCVPYAPPGHGMLLLPEADSNVWIEFEGGDPSRPIWAGCWWPSDKAASISGPTMKLFETAAGNRITLDDTSGSESISLQDKSGATVTLNQQGIELKKGGMSVQVSDSQVAINGTSLTVM
jgi:uncharacterized protein involved in type VI secretion and phage assembly